MDIGQMTAGNSKVNKSTFLIPTILIFKSITSRLLNPCWTSNNWTSLSSFLSCVAQGMAIRGEMHFIC